MGWGYQGESICLPRETAARLYADGSRYWMLRGDAELSRHDVQCLAELGYSDARQIIACAGGHRRGQTVIDGRFRATALDNAMRYWHRSSDWGRPFGAQPAIMSQRRLQAHMVQCLSSADGASLQRISRGGRDGSGETIQLSLIQRSLAALGYYSGPIDGGYSTGTRAAIRGFQRELGYDETGVLAPRQMTLLICHAAQTARDAQVQNALGIMYTLGLGVDQNIDLALEWLETAALRNDSDAHFNLAMIFGTGRVLESYRLCGIVENAEQADAYLREAARLGHRRAREWCGAVGCQPSDRSARERWNEVRERLDANGDPGPLGTAPSAEGINPPPISQLPPACLHAEARQAQGPPR